MVFPIRVSTSLMALIALIPLLAVSAAKAEEQLVSLGAYRDWTAYKSVGQGTLTCFAVAKPTSSLPTNVNRDPTYFFVTTRPEDGTINETSIDIGYPFKRGSKVTVKISGTVYDFHTESNTAWLSDIAREPGLVKAMKGGSNMVVEGISQRGTKTKDTYSLMGITQALNAVVKGCK